MTRIFTVALGLLLVAVWTPGVAGHHETTTFEGMIEVGTAASGYPVCSGQPTSELTSDIWDVEGFEGHTFQLEMAFPLDADVYFYDAACNRLNYVGGAGGGLAETEAGIVPDTARWAGVWGDEGSGAYRLTLGEEGPDLVPRTELRFYAGGGGVTTDTQSFPGADEIPGVENINYGGAILPIHGVESTVTIDILDASGGGYAYEFQDPQGEIVSTGCVHQSAGATTLEVPAGSSELILFTGDFLFGCEVPGNVFGSLEVTFE